MDDDDDDVEDESASVVSSTTSVFLAGDSSSRRRGNISTCARMNVRSGKFCNIELTSKQRFEEPFTVDPEGLGLGGKQFITVS